MILEEVAEFARDAATAYLMRRDPQKQPLVLCLGFKPKGEPVVIGVSGSTMPAVATATRQILLAEGCVQYAFMSEIWISPTLAAKKRVPAHLADDREDGLSIIAGSRDRVILRTYFVRRSKAKRSVKLQKHREVDSSKPGVMNAGTGFWGQLLAPEFDATGNTGYFDEEGWHAGHFSERLPKKRECC